jgi:uncharacterized protein YbaR (Trm112 family)
MGDAVVIPPELLELLSCTVCLSDVRLEIVDLRCVGCDRRYPIEDGIPIMCVDAGDEDAARQARTGAATARR